MTIDKAVHTTFEALGIIGTVAAIVSHSLPAGKLQAFFAKVAMLSWVKEAKGEDKPSEPPKAEEK